MSQLQYQKGKTFIVAVVIRSLLRISCSHSERLIVSQTREQFHRKINGSGIKQNCVPSWEPSRHQSKGNHHPAGTKGLLSCFVSSLGTMPIQLHLSRLAPQSPSRSFKVKLCTFQKETVLHSRVK